ncbi:MAG TPA: ArsC/Spx/MgsR family protein [Methylococcaceae bacterium]|nr:ArsC/Spx/MgsR family protein [Methylococcaceae bacterium]
MATIRFWEKPGCVNNTRQKRLLQDAGHTLLVRDLLAEPWAAETLRPFFGHLPVADWFNRSAPAVKDGTVTPEILDEQTALTLMLRDPLLIRRPLMQVGDEQRVGFVPEEVAAWIGLNPVVPDTDLETCPRENNKPCPANS